MKSALAGDSATAPSLSYLAEAAGVSPRTLQRHFARLLGLSPHAAVQQLRLAAARQTLRSGEVASVLEATLRHGFEHPGRFSIAYSRTFGEAPSATLRAARTCAASAASTSGTPILLRVLEPGTPGDAVCPPLN
ncbi:helix-turn-helix domain-containing protein [Siccirubricoccus deserti]